MFKRLTKKAVFFVLCLLMTGTFLACSNPYLEDMQSIPTLKAEAEPTPQEKRNDPNMATGTLSLGLYGYDTLNPLATKNDCIREYMSLVYDSLIVYDNECRPTACIANSWETSDGGVTWKIKIKENVFFHDGSNMTVYDVKNTLEWLKNNESFYSFCAKGVKEYNVLSQYEIDIILDAPDALFLSKLNFPIIKSEELGSSFTEPNGTGMYRYKTKEEMKFLFSINNDYFGNIPKIKDIELKCFEDSKSLYESNVDVILSFGDDTIKHSKKSGATVCRYPSTAVCAMIPSEKTKAEVKHFVNNAIDKNLLVRATMADAASVKEFLLPEDTYFMKNFSISSNVKYSEQKPESLKFIVNKNDEELLRMALIAKKQIEAKEINCEVLICKEEEFSVYLNSGEYDFAFMNYDMKCVPDLERFFAQNGIQNYNKFYDESVNSLILSIKNAYADSEISGVKDDSTLHSYVNNQTLKLSAKLIETLPIICLCNKDASVIISDRVEGVDLYNFTFWNTMDIIDWSVKEA